jgi:hypothetical protein
MHNIKRPPPVAFSHFGILLSLALTLLFPDDLCELPIALDLRDINALGAVSGYSGAT